jgi:DegV family protein with EDD domain
VEDQKKYDIEVAPLTVRFGDQVFLDGIEITNSQFFAMLSRAQKLPSTSQVNPQQFYHMFRPYLEAGDDVIGMFLASTISGTYQSACTAKDMLSADGIPADRLFIIDTLTATMGHTLLACEAAKYRNRGYPAEKIVACVMALVKKVRFLAIVDTLKYLHLGGRISAPATMVSGLFSIKPLLTMTEGKILPIGKARGLTAAFRKLQQEIEKIPPDLRYEIVFAHADAPDLLTKAVAQLQKSLGFTSWIACSIGSVLGAYSGPNCVGIAYIAAE